MSAPDRNSARLEPLCAAMRDFSETGVRSALGAVFDRDAAVRLCHPFGAVVGPDDYYDTALAPLFAALPDLERRDLIRIAGRDDDGEIWAGCMGHFVGTFAAPFLDIAPTGHLAHMRFHEFYRFDGDRVVEVQAIWDIPELMLQARAWPLSPSLGREGLVPGPMPQDGLGPHDTGLDQASRALVMDMLTQMSRHPAEGGPDIMQLARFWSSRMNWYGPAGIGTARGIAGFRNWHQIPFLKAMPDRKGGTTGTLTSHFIAEGNYVAVTGWPNMHMTLTGDGWLGIAPAGQKITIRSLDFWRVENGLIRENWVLLDLLDVYRQVGVDVFARLRDFNKARTMATVPYPAGEV